MITLPPPAHRIVIDYLQGLDLIGAPVSAFRLDALDDPREFVVVLQTGGSGRVNRHVLDVQITVDCYAATPGLAADLAMRVEGAILALPSAFLSISAVSWSTTPRDNPDPDTSSARYSASYSLTVICR